MRSCINLFPRHGKHDLSYKECETKFRLGYADKCKSELHQVTVVSRQNIGR
jgi:hypothetical protein